MVTISDVINLSLTKDEILSCLRKTQSIDFLDNLRKRHPNVQFDCKLRGYIGELAIKKWFLQNGIEIEATDYMPDDDSIDIDFIVAGTNIELKTSLIPDKDKDIATVLANRDIKLIRRNNQSIEELKGDVHMQIYYKQKTHAKDEWLSQQDVDLSGNVECLYKQLRADAYLSTTFFVAWIDKPSLIEYIHSLPETKQTWSFANSMREFWRCPLQNSRKPIELVAYFQELIKSYHLPILTYDTVPEEDQFTTYLPLYTIRAACGYFGEGEPVEEEGWINAEGIGRLNRNMFVVRAVGHSMEPRINDGDYCVFQSNPAGSRQGKIILAQHRGYFDEENAGAYSIKEYSSEKSFDEDGNWQHEKIVLKPYNRDYDPIELTPDDIDDFRVVGEFIGIIRPEEPVQEEKMICPECGGELVERKGPYGTFYGCSNYPQCHYMKKK